MYINVYEDFLLAIRENFIHANGWVSLLMSFENARILDLNQIPTWKRYSKHARSKKILCKRKIKYMFKFKMFNNCNARNIEGEIE